MRPNPTAAAILAVVLLAMPRVEAQTSIEAAKNLYASAEYEGALTMLNSLMAGGHSREEQRSIELYRVLCLLATGRESDAAGAVASLVERNPLYRPSDDLPPRVRSVFDETRQRLLPEIVQTNYREAKAAFDTKDYATARRLFVEVRQLLADPDIATEATQSPLSDLETLAAGFEELSVKALAPPEPVAAAPLPVPIVENLPPPPPPKPKIYSSDDPNVVPPIVVNQRIPAFPGPIRMARSGVVQVLIDLAGQVESATMLQSISPQYDDLTLTAAKSWRYAPARVNGAPVKFLKRIQVSVVPSP